MKKVAISIGLVVVVALVFCLIPLKEVAYAITVDYEDTETYYESEPYEELQNVTKPLDYQVLQWGSGGYEKLDGSYVCGPHHKIMNRAEVAGYFAFRLVLYTMGRDKFLDLQWEYPNGITNEILESEFDKLILEKNAYLEPEEIGEAAWSIEELLGKECTEVETIHNWEILPQEITEQEMVIKYRQVEKQRTVTRQRQETHYRKVTLLDYLLHY